MVGMDAHAAAREIRHRLGDRIHHPAEVMAEIERIVAEDPSTTASDRVALELELMRLAKRRAA